MSVRARLKTAHDAHIGFMGGLRNFRWVDIFVGQNFRYLISDKVMSKGQFH